jgi:hypothetical protein
MSDTILVSKDQSCVDKNAKNLKVVAFVGTFVVIEIQVIIVSVPGSPERVYRLRFGNLHSASPSTRHCYAETFYEHVHPVQDWQQQTRIRLLRRSNEVYTSDPERKGDFRRDRLQWWKPSCHQRVHDCRLVVSLCKYLIRTPKHTLLRPLSEVGRS